MLSITGAIRRFDALDSRRVIAGLAASLVIPYAVVAFVLARFFGGPFTLASAPTSLLTDRPPVTDVANWLLYALTGSLVGPLLFHVAAAIATFAAGAAVVRRSAGSNRAVAIFYLLFATHVLFHIEVFTMRDSIPLAASMAGFVYSTTLPRAGQRSLGMGLCAGLGWMTRATGVLFIVWIAIFALARRTSGPGRLKEAGLALGVFLLVSSPWQTVLTMRLGHPSLSPFPGNGLYNAVKGDNELIETVYPWLDIDYLDAELEPFLVREYAGMSARSIVEYARRRPVQFVALQGKKIATFFATVYTPPYAGDVTVDESGLHVRTERLVTFNALLWPLYLPTGAGLLAFLAFLFRLDRANPVDAIIACIFVTFVALHLVIWVESRFRLPVDPILFIGSALYLERRLRGARRHTLRPAE